MTAPEVSRRQVLVGGAALAFLTACSSGDDGGEDAGADDAGTTTTAAGGTLLQLLPPQGVLTTEGPQRVPVAIAGPDGVPLREGLEPVEFEVRMDTGEPQLLTV